MSEVTQILWEIKDGKQESAEQLLSLVYTELKRITAQKMAGEAPGNTLQPTALVHEAWMRLVGEGDPLFENKAHFFTAAAEAMRAASWWTLPVAIKRRSEEVERRVRN
jgi:RNA polymerase sigma factor (TIGR02999 family)